ASVRLPDRRLLAWYRHGQGRQGGGRRDRRPEQGFLRNRARRCGLPGKWTWAGPRWKGIVTLVTQDVCILPSAPNFRDLGGLRTESGRTVRGGLLYRSDACTRSPRRTFRSTKASVSASSSTCVRPSSGRYRPTSSQRVSN